MDHSRPARETGIMRGIEARQPVDRNDVVGVQSVPHAEGKDKNENHVPIAGQSINGHCGTVRA